MSAVELAPVSESTDSIDHLDFDPNLDRSEEQEKNYHEESALQLLNEQGITAKEADFYNQNLKLISDLVTDGDERSLELAQRQYAAMKTFLEADQTEGKLSADQLGAVEDLLATAIGDAKVASLDPDAQAWADEDPSPEGNAFVDSEEYDLDDPNSIENSVADVIETLMANETFSEAQATDLCGVVYMLAQASDIRDTELTERLDIRLKEKIRDLFKDSDEADINDKITKANEIVMSLKQNHEVSNPEIYEDPMPSAEEVKLPAGASALDEQEVHEAVAPELDSQELAARKSLGERMKLRWTAVKTLIANPAQIENWKNAFGAQIEQETQRRGKAAKIVGVAAVGLAAYAAYKSGMDVIPGNIDGDGFAWGNLDILPGNIDNDGFDLNPFNNSVEAPVPVDTGVGEVAGAADLSGGGESAATAIAFQDTINQGDGVTSTMSDFISQRYGKSLSSEQMSQLWSDISQKHSSTEISSWFPGSKVGGEWGVTYGGTGAGGMTSKGVETVTDVAKQLGYI